MRKGQLEKRSVKSEKLEESAEREDAYNSFVSQRAAKERIKHQNQVVCSELNKVFADSVEANQFMLALWERTLYATVEEFFAQYSPAFRSSLENLWEKYLQPLHSIFKERDAASVELAGYLKDLGYE